MKVLEFESGLQLNLVVNINESLSNGQKVTEVVTLTKLLQTSHM